jgi:hypothetical protein
MTPVFKKLNFKAHKHIVCLNAPISFQTELKAMSKEAEIFESLSSLKSIEFAIVFATTQSQIDKAATQLNKKLMADGVLWFCYPKGTSKRYTCEFNRDTGWKFLGELGYEPVRQVAIDEDWSALRFRNPDFIKTMTRSFALTEKGKAKVAKTKK